MGAKGWVYDQPIARRRGCVLAETLKRTTSVKRIYPKEYGFHTLTL